MKQFRLKDYLRLSRRFSMDKFLTHEYDIPLVTVGHGKGLYAFGFLIMFPTERYSPKRKSSFAVI